MILEEIKKQNLEAMKNHDTVARGIFSVLMNKGLLESIKKRENGEELTDVDMVAILQKTIKELNDERDNYQKVNNTEEVKNITTQIEIVETFLPKMLSNDEIKEIILTLPDTTVPTVMKHFKANYAGKCDMRAVQEVLKSI